ncbi:unnamed protein product [Sphenostylis stenocarpa]|uniref:non-specific serine/threonine protein kinase n=1 Tax=Sphenostylis stenocarpa TaxID=92480 RepID=A0AA86SBN7_9FABA|nr:unnamed protein product [Sphenostylis stenocarpa]
MLDWESAALLHLISDFGLTAFSDHLKEDGLLHTTCGTPAYVSPEVIVKKGYNGAKADIWSCGVILYCPPWFSVEARRLVTRLLDPNSNTRISICKVMESSWFKKPVPWKVAEVDLEVDLEEKCETPATINAFHIISLSEGFNLSPLFEEKKREEMSMAVLVFGGDICAAEAAREMVWDPLP